MIVFIIIFFCCIPLCFLPSYLNIRKQINNDQRVDKYPDNIRILYDKIKDSSVYSLGLSLKSQADYICMNVVIIDGYIFFEYGDENIRDCIPISECSIFKATETDVKHYNGEKTVKDTSSNKSVVGNAVIGGIIGGGVGAVVGAIAATDNNIRHSDDTKTVLVWDTKKSAAIFFCYAEKTYTIPCECDKYDSEFIKKN